MGEREQIFNDFQSFTGLEDAGKCFAILEQHNWNLQEAVQNALAELDSLAFLSHINFSDSVTDDTIVNQPQVGVQASSQFLSNISVSEFLNPHFSGSVMPIVRMLNFDVEYKNKVYNLVISDNEQVVKLKELLSKLTNLPTNKLKLHGWAHKNDLHVMDENIIRDLNLPKHNYLFLLSHDLPDNEHSLDVCSIVLCKMYEITVKVLDDQKEIKLTFPGDKTVKEVKEEIGYCLSIPVRRQMWSNWPTIKQVDDKVTLLELELPPKFTLELKVCSFSLKNDKDNHKNYSDVETDMESDIEDTIYDEVLEADNIVSPVKPLMPDNSLDQTLATEHFCREFVARFGEPHPIFYIGTLGDAIRESLFCKAKERKALCIYLHHDNSIFSNIFCSQVLCTETLVSFLSINSTFWAWDLTFPSNSKSLLQNCLPHFGNLAMNSIAKQVNSVDSLPVLLAIVRRRGTNEIIEVIEGSKSIDETVSRLIYACELYQAQLKVEIAEENDREARGKVLAEQDAAYEESLASDRAKVNTKLREEKEKQGIKEENGNSGKERIDKLIHKEEIKALKELLANLPDEPPPNGEANDTIITFRIKTPNGKTFCRRFYRHNYLSDLFNFISSHGFQIETYKLLTVYPRRDLKNLGSGKTFGELNMASQEVIILEEL